MKTILFTMWSFGLIMGVLAQGKSGVESSASVLLDSKKPSVFITFERFGKRTDVREGEGEDGVYLRLHNNSRFNIYLNTNGPDDLNSDHRVSYEVSWIPGMETKQLEKCPPIGTLLFHRTRIREIQSGKSIVFSVPRDHLNEGLGVYVYFSYEWELNGQNAGDFSIVHQAQFWSTSLTSKPVQ